MFVHDLMCDKNLTVQQPNIQAVTRPVILLIKGHESGRMKGLTVSLVFS